MNVPLTVVAAAVGLGVGYSGLIGANARIGIDRGTHPQSSDPHGAELAIDAELVPEAIIQADGSESLEASLAIDNKKAVGLRSSSAFEINTDRGAPVVPATPLPLSNLGAQRQGSSVVTIPPGLKDGYYQVHVRTAVLWDDGTEGGTRANLYFKVEKSQVFPMDLEAWFLEADVSGDLPKGKGLEK